MLRRDTTVKWVVLAGIALVLISALGLLSSFKKDKVTVHIGNQTVNAHVADTADEQKRGLGGYDHLAENEGMLFIFDRSDTWGIWMKDMKISIDIIWIDQDSKIIDIKKNVSPDTYPQVFTPSKPAKYILEVPAGFTDRANVGPGAFISFQSWLW